MKSQSKFLRVICKKCNNEQLIFNKPTSRVKCLKCNEVLAEPRGGKGIIKTTILEAF